MELCNGSVPGGCAMSLCQVGGMVHWLVLHLGYQRVEIRKQPAGDIHLAVTTGTGALVMEAAMHQTSAHLGLHLCQCWKDSI